MRILKLTIKWQDVITKNDTRVSSPTTSRTMWDRALATSGLYSYSVEIRSRSISRRERGERQGGMRRTHELGEERPYLCTYMAYAYDVTWKV